MSYPKPALFRADMRVTLRSCRKFTTIPQIKKVFTTKFYTFSYGSTIFIILQRICLSKWN